MKIFIAISFIFLGLMFIGLSIPLVNRQVPPNTTYGFRVKKTLENPDIWYDANAYSGWALIVAGIATVIGTVVLALIPGIRDVPYVLLVTGWMTLSVVAAMVATFRYLATL